MMLVQESITVADARLQVTPTADRTFHWNFIGANTWAFVEA